MDTALLSTGRISGISLVGSAPSLQWPEKVPECVTGGSLPKPVRVGGERDMYRIFQS